MSAISIFLFVGTLVISLFAMFRVKRMIAKYSQVPASSGLTGAETAQHILRASSINDVRIIEDAGGAGDHYDPTNKTLVLSSENYHGHSTAAVGIAAHECGHAMQHQQAYAPLEWRMGAVGLTNFSSRIVGFLPLLFFFGHGLVATHTVFMIMAAAWGVIMVFNLITLPVEFDASNRAKAILPQLGIIRGQDEMNGVNKVLNAAALTYVAAFVTSLAYFLYYMLLSRDSRR